MAMLAPRSPVNRDYDYTSSGIDNFLGRSIEQVQWQTDLGAWLNIPGGGTASLTTLPAPQATTQNINANASQVSGSLGSTLSIGDIQLDGTNGSITVGGGNNSPAVAVLGNSNSATGGF